MNQEQIVGSLRIVLPAIFAWLAAKGYSLFTDQAFITQVTSLVMLVISVAWSIWTHTNANQIKKVAAMDPRIEITVPTHVIAADTSIAAVVQDRGVPNVKSVAPVPEKVSPP